MLNLSKSIKIILILPLLLGTVSAPFASTSSNQTHNSTGLVELAEERPSQQLEVIVQKVGISQQAESYVVQLGGTVIKDLPMINAFSAEITAEGAIQLANLPFVRWISVDAPMVKTNCEDCIDTANLGSYYVQAIGADLLWNQTPYLQGQGIAVAVIDSGINDGHQDLADSNGMTRVIADVNLSSITNNQKDKYGHGTHIAGIIGGNGYHSDGKYTGVAPKVNLINVKVCDDQGEATTSDVVDGLQWVLENKDIYNIRLVNLSLNSTMAESYHTSPLDAALEILWFNGIVVVVSAGNSGIDMGNGVLFPPANDPFIITVGAIDDQGTPPTMDDMLASYSAYGITTDGFSKPDIVAPGTNIISLLPNPKGELWKEHRENLVKDTDPVAHYFRMSGTSMASAVTAGAVALLLQDEPNLNPDQVKFRLISTAHEFGAGSGAGYLDVYDAVTSDSSQSANLGTTISQLLWTGTDPLTYGSVNWGSVNWGSVNWGSVNWGTVNWGAVNWGATIWGSDYWPDQ